MEEDGKTEAESTTSTGTLPLSSAPSIEDGGDVGGGGGDAGGYSIPITFKQDGAQVSSEATSTQIPPPKAPRKLSSGLSDSSIIKSSDQIDANESSQISSANVEGDAEVRPSSSLSSSSSSKQNDFVIFHCVSYLGAALIKVKKLID